MSFFLAKGPRGRPRKPRPLCAFCKVTPVNYPHTKCCSFSCHRKLQVVNAGQQLGGRYRAKYAKYKCCICTEPTTKRPYCRDHRWRIKNGWVVTE